MKSPKELETSSVVDCQDLITIENMCVLCAEKIERASSPVEKKIYQRLLAILKDRAAELRRDAVRLQKAQ